MNSPPYPIDLNKKQRNIYYQNDKCKKKDYF